jgi:hypothetical protein
MMRFNMDATKNISMNVTDLRQSLRRSAISKSYPITGAERRKAADRRQIINADQPGDKIQRIWLTPGERTLIEDLYLLEDK